MTINDIKSNPCARDTVFMDVLTLLGSKPCNILEIGCMRNVNSRAGDGWSSVFWADHVQNFGGQFITSNTVAADLEVCRDFLKSLFNDGAFIFHFGDGEPLIGQGFDLIYLDGGDDPNDTLRQFSKCNFDKTLVLIDDYHTKGSLLPKENLHTLYQFSNGHLMALYQKGAPSFRTLNIVV